MTGTSIADAWAAERGLLRPLPEPCPEPFDLTRTVTVGRDSLAAFEGRQYGVPFANVGLPVEMRGCAGTIQILDPIAARVLAVYPRGSAQRILIDPSTYAGESTDRVIKPTPLGHMGLRLAALPGDGIQRRSIELYAALAEVAR